MNAMEWCKNLENFPYEFVHERFGRGRKIQNEEDSGWEEVSMQNTLNEYYNSVVQQTNRRHTIDDDSSIHSSVCTSKCVCSCRTEKPFNI